MDTRLKDLREDNNLSQQDCADIAYISKNSYIRYEKGIRMLPADTLLILADYYRTSTDYILKRTNEIKPYPRGKEVK